MTYYLFPLTIEETKNPKKKGWDYCLKNKSKWVKLGDWSGVLLDTYDRGESNIVHKNRVYMIHRDFINIDEDYRVYIGLDNNLSVDQVK